MAARRPSSLVRREEFDHARADLDDETAEQGGIDLGVQAGLLAQPGFQNRFQFGDFGVGQRAGAGDFGFGFAARLGDQAFISS